MSQKSAIRAFFNEHPPQNRAWRSEALQLRRDFGKLLTIANKVFEGPACGLSVFGSYSSHNMDLPALRLAYPNGAKLEIFDSLSLFSVSMTSPEKDVPQRFLQTAYRPDIDWSALHHASMPQEMIYTSHERNPRRFTFQMYEREKADLQKLVMQFSWLQKQAMGLTRPESAAQAQPPQAQAAAQPQTAPARRDLLPAACCPDS